MASSIIHMCVANEINKKINKDNSKILIGSIAPDISKHLGQNKVLSHFLFDEKSDVPNIDMFLKKYKKHLDDDFVMGYFIHLYTDYIWSKYFIPDFKIDDCIYKLDGTKEEIDKEKYIHYIYNDYTNLNVKLIDEYNMDLKIFYQDVPEIENIIEEIPMDKLKLIIDKAGVIIKETEYQKPFVFDITQIKKFIDLCCEIILKN